MGRDPERAEKRTLANQTMCLSKLKDLDHRAVGATLIRCTPLIQQELVRVPPYNSCCLVEVIGVISHCWEKCSWTHLRWQMRVKIWEFPSILINTIKWVRKMLFLET